MENPNPTPVQKKKGVALILTLGVLFMMGLIVGSFAFFATSTNRNTSEFMNTITASNLANSGYNYMVGAIQDYFNTIIPAIVLSRQEAQGTGTSEERKAWEERKEELNKAIQKQKEILDQIVVQLSAVPPTLPPDLLNSYIDSFTEIQTLRANLGVEPAIDDKSKITSNEFNVLQSALTTFLNGDSISFTNYTEMIKPETAANLDAIMFTNTDPPSWAIKYGFLKNDGVSVGQQKYDVDLDGMNNYIYVTKNGAQENIQWEWANSILNPAPAAANGLTTAQTFANDNLEWEQKDSDWHNLYDERNKVFGRFAVMAKDESSLVNLESTLTRPGMEDLIQSMSTPPPASEINDTIKDITGDMTGSASDMNEVLAKLELEEGETSQAYTTASTDNTDRIDVNTATPMDFFQYLGSGFDPNATSLPVNFPEARTRANAKIAINLRDYTDINSIPYALTKFNWTDQQVTADNPWIGLADTDIFYGIEGVRISEIMIHPEQAFCFENQSALAIKMTCSGARDDGAYYYKTDGASTFVGTLPFMYEEQRDPAMTYWNAVRFSNTVSHDAGEGSDAVLLEPALPLKIVNPGGFNQVWVKMRITALNSAMGTEAFTKLMGTDGTGTTDGLNAKISSPDIKVQWASGTTGTQLEIAQNSKVTELSADLQTLYSTNAGSDFVPDTSLFDVLTVLYSITTTDFSAIPADLVMATDTTSATLTIHNPELNFPKPTAADPKPSAEFTWDASKFQDVSAAVVKNAAKTQAELSQYPFGSRVLEMTLFDAGAGLEVGTQEDYQYDVEEQDYWDHDSDPATPEILHYDPDTGMPIMETVTKTVMLRSSTPRDEMIGVFYCFNTNGFTEDDKHLVTGGDGQWKDEDNDFVWFCSVGVPEWTPPEEQPEWMLATNAGKAYPWSSETDDAFPPLFNKDYGIPNTNVCVFPRKNTNLKMRFRMVDLSDSRFNRSSPNVYTPDTPQIDYTIGLNKITFDGMDILPGDNLSDPAFNAAERASLVGRPKWNAGDEVTVEIKEMVVTQQVYSPQLLEVSLRTAPSASYRYIDPDQPALLYLHPGSELKNASGDFLHNESIYYRNQRLERNNRPANELHSAEYVEFFNGTAQEVNMDGWVLKVEQYRKDPFGTYQLLGPRYANKVYDRIGVIDSSNINYQDMTSRGCLPRPDYILLGNTVVPANEAKGKIPYAILTNQLNTYVYDEEMPDSLKTGDSKYQAFYPMGFAGSWDLAIGPKKNIYGDTPWEFQNYFINVFSAWNYLSGNDGISPSKPDQQMVLFQTNNIPYADIDSNSWGDEESLHQTANGMFNPLHFRDDADRIVLTLFAPKDRNKRFKGNGTMLVEDGPKFYDSSLASGKLKFEQVTPDKDYFGLIEEQEWLTSYQESLGNTDPSNTDTSVTESMAGSYAIVDRAVIDRDATIHYFDPLKGESQARLADDWYGGRAMYLNRFYTDPLLLRMGKTGSVGNETPFDDSVSPGFVEWGTDGNGGITKSSPITSNEELAQKAAKYWSVHREVFKAKLGPLGHVQQNVPQYVLTAKGSPGQPDYVFTEAADLSGVMTSNLNVPANLPNLPLDIPKNREAVINNFVVDPINYPTDTFYDLKHTGYGSYNDQIISYFFASPNGAFIKNAPLSSVAEICDIPAPAIENEPNGRLPSDPNSYHNAFVNGLEDAGQYMTPEQKRKIFASASADATLIHPAGNVAFNFNNYPSRQTGNQVAQITNSNPNPVVRPQAAASFKNWSLSYNFYATLPQVPADEQRFYHQSIVPGRYKIFIEGLNDTCTVYDADKNPSGTQLWDVFRSIIIASDGSAFSSVDAETLKRMGLAVIGGNGAAGSFNGPISQIVFDETDEAGNPVQNPLNPERVIQLLPASGEEYFSIQDHLEVSFLCDSSSTILSNSTEYSEYNPASSTEPSLQQLLTTVTSSPSFQKIRIHLVPREDVGKVNINTAPLHVLLRIPGFSTAVDPEETNPTLKGAANEVVQDIFEATHPADSTLKPYVFKDAGDLLVYENRSGPRGPQGNPPKGGRIFPFRGDDVGINASQYNTPESRSQFADLKCKIFREAFPHIQFAGNSFEIVSMGQALLPYNVGNTSLNVLASQKISVTVNLKELLADLQQKWVQNPINIGKNVYDDAKVDDPIRDAILNADALDGYELRNQRNQTTGEMEYFAVKGAEQIPIEITNGQPNLQKLKEDINKAKTDAL